MTADSVDLSRRRRIAVRLLGVLGPMSVSFMLVFVVSDALGQGRRACMGSSRRGGHLLAVATRRSRATPRDQQARRTARADGWDRPSETR